MSSSRAFEEWAQFFGRESHVLSRHPALLFQQAANQPPATAPARAAEQLWTGGNHRRPWLRWVNKPRDLDPTLLTLPHRFWVSDAVFTPDGRRVLSSGGDLQLWDADTGALVATLTGHKLAHAFCLSPDGRRIATAAMAIKVSKDVLVWDLERGQRYGTLPHGYTVLCLAFSPDGRLIASGAEDQPVRIWSAVTFENLQVLPHRNRPQSCAFSPDGRTLAVTGGGWTHDWEITLWDVATGRLQAELPGHGDETYACAFSPDGTRLVTASDDKTLKVWDLATGEAALTLTGHTWFVRACAWSRDGKRIVSGGFDKTVRLWDAATGEPLGLLVGHSDKVLTVAFSPDGSRIVSGSQDSTARVWDAAAPLTGEAPAKHRGTVSRCAFSPDGSRLATSSHDGSIRQWDVATGAPGVAFQWRDQDFFYSCAWSPSGERIAGASHMGFVVVVDSATGREIWSRQSDESHCHGVAFSPDGKLLASGAIGVVRLWDTAQFRQVRALEDENPMRWMIGACAFSPDGKRLLDSSLRLWELASGRLLTVLGGEPKGSPGCEYSPDGSRILTSWERGVRVWNARTWEAELTLGRKQKGQDGSAGCAWSRDGERIVSALKASELVIHDAASGRELARFHTGGQVGGVAATDRYVACGDAGGVVYLLELIGFESPGGQPEEPRAE